ncbi:pimeloyl-ACP methyl ester carboxylesterase [Allocatelliglobosispora scoriae]|uniref:Pimeloyl-ACP methyl ester carboxylesterase n=1 Tax=Allocatelliglobosispora scoriae TaxID=643052 RepID=A0A841C2T6_9ACTN|nr:alpha/beta hydrolase [Allocatelliglobosispora scoriae]MBB5874216.1 pimeloyl-ACP methyl ester carboxylesterase [Allocatelliglobosispora scoriae]
MPDVISESFDVGDGVVQAATCGQARPGVPTVVIVPGLGAVGSMDRIQAATARWTRCVVLDLPGFHQRGPDSCAPNVAAVADWTAAWLARYATDPVVLVGHSTGGQAMLRAALTAPAAVGSLVLAGVTFDPGARTPMGLIGTLSRTLGHDPLSALGAIAADFGRAGLVALAAFARSGLADPPERLIGRVRCPVVVVSGEHDYLSTPPWGRRLAALARQGSSFTLPGAHAFPHSLPEEFSLLLAEAAALCPTGPQRDRSHDRTPVLTV